MPNKTPTLPQLIQTTKLLQREPSTLIKKYPEEHLELGAKLATDHVQQLQSYFSSHVAIPCLRNSRSMGNRRDAVVELARISPHSRHAR
jgi:hypothetical protein